MEAISIRNEKNVLVNKSRILFISFQAVKDPMFLCAFDCTTDTCRY